MYPDFEQLLSALNAENARYLIVGGYAVGEYAQPRATKDLDILLAPILTTLLPYFVLWLSLAPCCKIGHRKDWSNPVLFIAQGCLRLCSISCPKLWVLISSEHGNGVRLKQ